MTADKKNAATQAFSSPATVKAMHARLPHNRPPAIRGIWVCLHSADTDRRRVPCMLARRAHGSIGLIHVMILAAVVGGGVGGERAAMADLTATFVTVIDTNTPQPGGSGDFTSFGRYPAIGDGVVVFRGNGSIYVDDAGPAVVADFTTLVPDGTGAFIGFGPHIAHHSGITAFRGIGIAQDGIYADMGGLVTIADRNTPIPGGSGDFAGFSPSRPAIDGQRIVFLARGDADQVGIYRYDAGVVTALVDGGTAIPGGVGTFTSFGAFSPSLDNGDIAFRGGGADQDGIYADIGGLSMIADLTTTVPPDLVETFASFGDVAAIRGVSVAFRGADAADRHGVYLSTAGVLTVVADSETVLPGGDGVETFVSFEDPCLGEVGGGLVAAFAATDAAGRGGIYCYSAATGTLMKVVAVDDVIAIDTGGATVCETVSDVAMGPGAFENNTLVVYAAFADGGLGIYAATIEDGLPAFDDCNNNQVPDECEFVDCNGNGNLDDCDILDGASSDCNADGIPDECEIDDDSIAPGGPFYCTETCDPDCNANGVPDDCEPDADGDGVPDVCDACPDTPPDIAVDPIGCVQAGACCFPGAVCLTTPNADDCTAIDGMFMGHGVMCGSDSDGDGVAVCNDLCPDDPNKTHWETCGCGEPEDDTDEDGTKDCVDGCPDDPEKTEPGFCGCGEVEEDVGDADGDGVANCADQCPGVDDTADGDGDGVPDCTDVCPGFDDTLDDDEDEVPDGCDACLGFDDRLDDDADGVPNECDPCPDDNPDDSDGDGVCDTLDDCPADNPDDSDGDGVCESADVCPGFDDTLDEDEDGVPDDCDVCPGFDDGLDEDNDGVPDGCDACSATPPGAPVDSVGCPFLGACCFYPSGCLDDTDPVTCEAAGGTYQGNSTTCDLGCTFSLAGACCFPGEACLEVSNEDTCIAISGTFLGIGITCDVDSDGDDTPDCDDECPDDPDKTEPEECGCGEPEHDADWDGTPNCIDDCPHDPDKTVPGVCGCGETEDLTDSDGDSVPNCVDGCPGEDDVPDGDGDGTPDCLDDCPEDPDKTVPLICGCGVPDDDTGDDDGDGVANCIDQCPGIDDGIDSDDDGVPDCVDICPGFDDNMDSDDDRVPNGCDQCPGFDDAFDEDEDDVPDDCDACPGFDDAVDEDGDAVPDDCDACLQTPPDTPVDAYGCSWLGACCFSQDLCVDGVDIENCENAGGLYQGNGTTCDLGCDFATDDDADGVPNDFDLCPDTPPDAPVDEDGCALPGACCFDIGVCFDDVDGEECTAIGGFFLGYDTVCGLDIDGDGTLDCADACPDDPDKTEVGDCGCGEPEDDADSDGTPDCVDGCPDDPAKIEPGVCDCGVWEDVDDSDGDETPNCLDGCPDDSAKTEPGVCGCGEIDVLTDTDGDDTPDCADECPDDPDKAALGACGCGVSDDDTDGDGTEDCLDACPNDYYKTETGACGCGMPDIDSDGDGVADCVDQCPNTPDDTDVGDAGCPYSGACCFDVGQYICVDATTPGDCSLTGGWYQGNGSMCDQGCVFPPPIVDSDGDGVDDDEENQAPNGGDGNDDGTPDGLQEHVASFLNTDDVYVTIASAETTSLASVLAHDNPSPDDTPAGVAFPAGFFSYQVNGLSTPGAATQVDIIVDLPDGATIDTYWKYGPTPDNPAPHWYEFLYDGATGVVIDDRIITLHLVDGLRGDDDLTANGVIIDPGAPAVSAGGPPGFFATETPSDIGCGTGICGAGAGTVLPLAPVIVGAWRRARRRR